MISLVLGVLLVGYAAVGSWAVGVYLRGWCDGYDAGQQAERWPIR